MKLKLIVLVLSTLLFQVYSLEIPDSIPIEYKRVIPREEAREKHRREVIGLLSVVGKYIDTEMTDEIKEAIRNEFIGKYIHPELLNNLWQCVDCIYSARTEHLYDVTYRGEIYGYAMPNATLFTYSRTLCISSDHAAFDECQDVLIYEHGIDSFKNDESKTSWKSYVKTEDDGYHYVLLRNKEEQGSSRWSCRVNINKETGKMELIRFTDGQSDYSKINDDRVRLRAGEGRQSQTIGYLNTGDKVRIIRRSENKELIEYMENYWYMVELPDGKTGWVYGEYVDIQ